MVLSRDALAQVGRMLGPVGQVGRSAHQPPACQAGRRRAVAGPDQDGAQWRLCPGLSGELRTMTISGYMRSMAVRIFALLAIGMSLAAAVGFFISDHDRRQLVQKRYEDQVADRIPGCCRALVGPYSERPAGGRGRCPLADPGPRDRQRHHRRPDTPAGRHGFQRAPGLASNGRRLFARTRFRLRPGLHPPSSTTPAATAGSTDTAPPPGSYQRRARAGPAGLPPGVDRPGRRSPEGGHGAHTLSATGRRRTSGSDPVLCPDRRRGRPGLCRCPAGDSTDPRPGTCGVPPWR